MTASIVLWVNDYGARFTATFDFEERRVAFAKEHDGEQYDQYSLGIETLRAAVNAYDALRTQELTRPVMSM